MGDSGDRRETTGDHQKPPGDRWETRTWYGRPRETAGRPRETRTCHGKAPEDHRETGRPTTQESWKGSQKIHSLASQWFSKVSNVLRYGPFSFYPSNTLAGKGDLPRETAGHEVDGHEDQLLEVVPSALLQPV